MKLVQYLVILGLALLVLYQKFAPSSSSQNSPQATVQTNDADINSPKAIPEKALQVYQIVCSTGHAPEGYVGGRVFENRERRLPSGGDYREFDIDPHEAYHGRNAERIIIEWKTKKAWYTSDHYHTFVPLP